MNKNIYHIYIYIVFNYIESNNQKEMNWLSLAELYCFSHNNYHSIVEF